MDSKGGAASLKIPVFTLGDINGVVYVFAGNLGSFVIMISTLMSFGWSDDLIFKRVIPGLCTGLLFSGLYYSWMAYRLAKKENRSDVTALPFGVSTPVMFVYLFSVILPIQFGLGLSPEDTWQAAMAACFIGGIIELSGGFVGPYIRKMIPRAVMLGTVGGIAIAWMSLRGVIDVFNTPMVGLPVLMVALLGLVAGYRLPKNIPPLVVALIFGIILSLAFNEARIVTDQLGTFTPPIPFIGNMIAGFSKVLPILLAIIPVEIYNFVETMDNVESAIAAGDNLSVKEAQIADGVATSIGACFGSVFPNTVWIGHAGLKKAGCGIGYAWVSAILFAAAGYLGVFNFIYYLLPGVVVSIVFLWCTQIMIAQAFGDTPRRYGAAIVIAMIPHIADIMYTQTSSIFQFFGQEMNAENALGIVTSGAQWSGIPYVKPGAILIGMVLGTLVAAIIDRKLIKAAITCCAGAVLTFFGIIHSTAMGIGTGPSGIVIGYLMAAGINVIFYLLRNKLQYERRYDYL